MASPPHRPNLPHLPNSPDPSSPARTRIHARDGEDDGDLTTASRRPHLVPSLGTRASRLSGGARRTQDGRRALGGLDLGAGPAVVLLQGFALRPRTYLDVAELLAERCRVLVPPLFAQPGCSWTADGVLADLEATLDYHGLYEVTLIGHSFGGALELNLAARLPERVSELVFVDTLAMSREWTLAVEAVHPIHLLWMATPRAAIDFTAAAVGHPLSLARAGWWGFRSDRRTQVEQLAATGIPRHVLWADRDSLLARADGAAFADDLGADFTVVHGRNRNPVDHDWIYRHPALLIEHLERLGVRALTTTT